MIYRICLFSLQTANSSIGEEIEIENEGTTEVLNTEDNSSDEACNNSSTVMEEVQEDNSAEAQLKHEIVTAICEALMLVDQMQGSLNDFEDVLDYAKKLFCRSNHELTKYWPQKSA